MVAVLFLLMLQTEHSGHHGARDPEAYARILEDPERDRWQNPQAVIDALRLRPNEIVADIGAGSGYFTRRIAKHASKVFAVDIDAKLLAKAAESSPANVETVIAKPNNPKLPRKSVDTVFFCDVLHHIQKRRAYIKTLDAALKPGGRIVVIDFHKRELPVGPKPAMKLDPEQLKAEFKKAGFRLRSEHRGFLEYQYFLEFER